MNKRGVLLEKIKKDGFPEKEVFVTVADFFDGNEDDGSIGANIYPDPPSLREFYHTLKEIENDDRTSSLLIRIADIDDTEWFYTDTVYIAGVYSIEEIKELLKPLKPDEVYKGMMYSKPSNIPPELPGSYSYSVWWD